ncbi:glycosyl transferase family 1 [Fadolivirus algeromassiliense]|jgi:glycosyltransferase involved in cell wall biosynthesis|uniref:Glycosyl transferase family 1 n=1 Tax=Fadolivirus FV1/VV64 TaxID=3070911 RepID=A0A7D3R193_9VIRU|nr:glycosyl transferase family 1 [Fadolivirus algeromassiliense]QKF94322.1 glycosyl transferase family 1 [Fadolivirus FV1/VV64]
MYKKSVAINKINAAKVFKPKRMVIGGIMYDVDSMQTLNKIKQDIDDKKYLEEQKLEEQKHQKVLVKKTRSRNVDEKVITIITDNNAPQQSNQNRKNKPKVVEEPVKPKFTLKSTAGQRKMPNENKPIHANVVPLQNTINNTTNSTINNTINNADLNKNRQTERNVANNTYTQMNDYKDRYSASEVKKNIVSNTTNIDPNTNKPKLNIRTHDRKPLTKNSQAPEQNNNTDDNIQSNNNAENNDEPKQQLRIVRTNTRPINKQQLQTIQQITDQDNTTNNIEQDIEQDNLNQNNINDIINDQPVDGFFTQQYSVTKNQWYIVSIKSPSSEKGLVKILDGNKTQLLPLIRIANDMFLYKNYGAVSEYRIYFKTLNSPTIDVYVIGLTIKDIKVNNVTFDVVSKNIDLWKFRKLYDLDFINYYLSNIKLNVQDKFIDRFSADFELYKNTDYFNKYIKTLKIDTKTIKRKPDDETINILYLINSSIEYETNGYTVRTHNLLKNISDDKFRVYAITKYGYPHERDLTYHQNQINEEYNLDNVIYKKLLNKTDNMNDSNTIEYLKKYINQVIKLCIESNVKIIHACSNYLNGIVALYASKYLGIKCIYEVRNMVDEPLTVNRLDLVNSDMLKMMNLQEKNVLSNVDHIITVNNCLKEKLINNSLIEENITIIENGVDTMLFVPNNDYRMQLRNKYNINDNTPVIGYIGNLIQYEGIDTILKCIKLLKDQGINIKFVIGGDGSYKNEISNLIDSLKLNDNVIQIGKIEHRSVNKYYNMFDIVIYPRKISDFCNSKSSSKLLEAMLMEKPVIVSKSSGWSEIIIDGLNGLYCDPDNLNDIVDKIKMLISDVELSNNISKKAREWVLENREFANISKKLTNLYEKLLQ